MRETADHGRTRALILEDPYRFGSSIGEFDRYLLGEGTHLRPWTILGAHLREQEGYERKAALVEAGRLRLRAVLMTTLTLVFALLPLLLGTGAGSESRAPLAAVVVGGIVSSTVLTLILVPVVYNFFDWGSGLVSRGVGAVLGTSSPTEEVVEQKPEEEAAPEEKPEKPEDKEEKGSQRGPSPRPSPQPGSAISLNPSEPDTV